METTPYGRYARPPPTLPSSVLAVLEALSAKAPMTGKELREFTGLPRRTTYTALRRLREQGLLQEKASLRDTRQTYYWLADPQRASQLARQDGEADEGFVSA